MRLILVLLCSVIVSSGCSAVNSNNNYAGPVARKGAPTVYICPVRNIYKEAVVGILPFQVPSNTEKEETIRVAALFKDVLLNRQAFKVIKLLDAPYQDLNSALLAGKEAGVDLVLAGTLHYAVAGTELGGARVDVSVRMLNTHTDNTVWYVAQAMDQDMDYPDLSVMGRLQTVFSGPPVRKATGGAAVPNMVAQIAADMADVFDGARYVAP